MPQFEPAGVETPCLLLDRQKLEANARRMRAAVERHGVALRPHLKTAKSIEIGDIATAGSRTQITVSTLKEAEYFIEAGYSDVLYAVGVTPNKFPRVERILRDLKGDLTLVTDNAVVAAAAADFAAQRGLTLRFLIEVDCGDHRAGVQAGGDSLLPVAEIMAAASGIELRGVMTHGGQSYGVNSHAGASEVAAQEVAATTAAASRLRAAGMPCEVVSIGSTPSALYAKNLDGVTEVRAGVYVFFDLSQFALGACARDDIALTVLATVIGHNKAAGTVVVDAGGLALSKDLGVPNFLPDAGYGLLCDPISEEPLADLAVASVSQEHGVIPVSDMAWYDRLPIGAQVRIQPNHACMTAAAHDSYLVLDEGKAPYEWRRVNGW